MSLRVYLKGTVRYSDKFSVDEGGRFRWRGEILGLEGNQLFLFSGSNIKPQLDEGLTPYIDFFTLQGKFRKISPREAGVYRHGTAEAQVRTEWWKSDASGDWFVEVSIVSNNIDDGLELFNRIQVGSIRPVKSFEGPQLGEPAYKLAEKIQQLLDHGGGEVARKLEGMLAITLPVLPLPADPNFLRLKVAF